jgi:hypothetical protein
MTDGAVNRIVALTFLGIVVAAVAVVVLGQTPRFYPGSTSVTRLTAQYDVRPDGDLDVTETIVYAYGAGGHPLDRVVQVRRPDGGKLETQASDRGTDRVWEVSDITATDQDGTPVPVRTKELDPNLPPLTGTGIDGWDTRLSDLRIQIGKDLPYVEDTKREATFVLRYRVHGALDQVPGGYELNWPDQRRLADRYDLRIPVDEIRVIAPGDVGTAACTAHRAGLPGEYVATPCSTATTTGRTAYFAHGPDRAAMAVKVRIPGDVIAKGGAEYDASPGPRWVRVVLYAGGAVLLLVLVGLVARRVIRARQRSSAARA